MEPTMVWVIVIVVLTCCLPICWYCCTINWFVTYSLPNRCDSVETLFQNGEIVDLSGKIIVITGANSGIGKEMTRYLYRTKAKIIMACRNLEKAERAKNEIISDETVQLELFADNIEIIELDLASFKSINQFVQTFKDKYNKLDILCLNAGVLPQENNLKTEDLFEITFGVNHVGHMLLALQLKDCMNNMNEGEYSRLIIVSSVLHRWMYSDEGNEYGKCGCVNKWCCCYKSQPLYKFDVNRLNEYDVNAAYAKSKLLNIMFAREWANKYPFGEYKTKVVSVTPGVSFETGLVDTFICNNCCHRLDTVGQCTYTQTWCSITDINNLKHGGHYKGDMFEETIPTSKNDELCGKVWEKSLAMINSKNIGVNI